MIETRLLCSRVCLFFNDLYRTKHLPQITVGWAVHYPVVVTVADNYGRRSTTVVINGGFGSQPDHVSCALLIGCTVRQSWLPPVDHSQNNRAVISYACQCSGVGSCS